ncbi:hypothetical protein F4808DRAFT_417720 [Astrocystis sublimbata]|nr:hypothetical protein F4808DRAFT_417720 [Astrocystis sublimbata]
MSSLLLQAAYCTALFAVLLTLRRVPELGRSKVQSNSRSGSTVALGKYLIQSDSRTPPWRAVSNSELASFAFWE